MGTRIATEDMLVTNWLDKQAAGVTDVVPASRIDMQGWDGCLFLVKIGAIDATGTVDATVRHSATDAAGAKTTLAAAQLADTGDNSLIALDIRDPQLRYLDLIVERGTANSEVDSIVAIQYRGSGLLPVTQPANVPTVYAVRPETA
jgi:hypothetical protein